LSCHFDCEGQGLGEVSLSVEEHDFGVRRYRAHHVEEGHVLKGAGHGHVVAEALEDPRENLARGGVGEGRITLGELGE
jgi:hypothetical protein